jgi:serine/threonine-protein kinase
MDHRIDIYAFGCLAYWLLTGRLVFEGTSATRMMLDHVSTPPSRPSLHAPEPIPADLERLVLDCLEKDPARRPSTAQELAARLAACRIPDRWTADRAERWWSTHVPTLAAARPAADLLLAHEGGTLRPRPQARPS